MAEYRPFLSVLHGPIEQLAGVAQGAQPAWEAVAVLRVPFGRPLRRRLAAAEGLEDLLGLLHEAEVDPLLRGALELVVILVEVDTPLALFGLHHALAERLLDRAERDRGRAVRQALDRLDAVLLQDALHPADGIALAVEQPADALEQIDVVGAVVAASAAPLHRLDLGEARLPKPQHMLGNVELFSDFTDGSERIRRLVQMPASLQLSTPLNRRYRRH